MIKKETTKLNLEEMTLDAKILIHKIQILKFIKKWKLKLPSKTRSNSKLRLLSKTRSNSKPRILSKIRSRRKQKITLNKEDEKWADIINKIQVWTYVMPILKTGVLICSQSVSFKPAKCKIMLYWIGPIFYVITSLYRNLRYRILKENVYTAHLLLAIDTIIRISHGAL